MDPSERPQRLIALSPLHAQQLLQRLGWSYYTLWKEVSMPNSPGLVWSSGDVNRAAANYTIGAGQLSVRSDPDNYKARMGLLLQRYYRQCFLPFGVGIAGVAVLTRSHRWASGDELLLQINSMINNAQKPAPPDLQIQFFETVVCIPLLHSAGVLELGTTDSIPESNELVAQILDFIRPGLSAAEMISPRDRICFEEPEIQLQYRGQNISDSYGSSSSSNSSVFSVRGASSGTTTTGGGKVISSPLNIMTPTSSAMVDFEIDILKQMRRIDMNTVSTAAAANLDELATISDQHVSLSFSASLVSAPPPTFLSNWNSDQKYATAANLDELATISDQHVSLSFSASLVSAPPPTFLSNWNSDQKYASESSGFPFNYMLQRGLPSCHDQDSLMQLSRLNQSEAGFPSCGSSGAPPPNYTDAYTHGRLAGHFIDNSPSNLIAHDSDRQSTLSIHDVGFKPWTTAAHNYRDIQMQVNPRSDSLLKRCLLRYLPKLGRALEAYSSAARAGARGRATDIALGKHDLSSSRLGYGDPNYMEGNIADSTLVQRNEAARKHMIGERERRRRQSESFKALRTLILPNAIKKADKLTILEHTLQHLKQLQEHVDELEQEKDLLSMQASQHAMISTSVTSSQQFLSPTQVIVEVPLSSPKTTTCELFPSIESQTDIMVTYHASDDQSPLFHLNLNIAIQLADSNDTIIKVLSALKQKKLHCIHMESNFLENISMLNTKLLGKYKDGENITPSPDQILEIEKWWRHLSRERL